MGYKIIQESNNKAHNVYELVLETIEDLKTLPNHIGAGSTAIILKGTTGGTEVHMKSPSGEWVVL